MSDNFSFRWGVDIFDNARTEIPNWILEYYYLVPVSNTEMMFIIHLASFKYESKSGRAMPSLTGSIRKRMGYKSNQGVINVEQGLVERGLLIVHKSLGSRSEYDFTPFSKAILEIVKNQSIKLDGLDQSIKLDESKKQSIKLDRSRQQNLTQRIKEESKNKNNRIDSYSLDSNWAQIQKLWETNIGFLAPAIVTQAQDLMDEIPQAAQVQYFQEAITRACAANARNWNYIKAILTRWIDQGGIDLNGSGKRQSDPDPSPLPHAETPTTAPLAPHAETWQQAQRLLANQMTQATYQSWIAKIKAAPNSNGTFCLIAESAIAKDWIDNRLAKQILRAIQAVNPDTCGLEVREL